MIQQARRAARDMKCTKQKINRKKFTMRTVSVRTSLFSLQLIDSCLLIPIQLLSDSASTQDYMIADSCYGRQLPSMITAMKEIVKEVSQSGRGGEIIRVPGTPADDGYGEYKRIVKARLTDQ